MDKPLKKQHRDLLEKNLVEALENCSKCVDITAINECYTLCTFKLSFNSFMMKQGIFSDLIKD